MIKADRMRDTHFGGVGDRVRASPARDPRPALSACTVSRREESVGEFANGTCFRVFPGLVLVVHAVVSAPCHGNAGSPTMSAATACLYSAT